MPRPVIFLCLLCVLAAGCLSGNGNGGGDIFSGRGTVVFLPQEGGIYGIVTEDGHRYLPLNLEERYQIHGLGVQLRARIRGERLMLSKWGTPIEIIEIEPYFEDTGESFTAVP